MNQVAIGESWRYQNELMLKLLQTEMATYRNIYSLSVYTSISMHTCIFLLCHLRGPGKTF